MSQKYYSEAPDEEEMQEVIQNSLQQKEENQVYTNNNSHTHEDEKHDTGDYDYEWSTGHRPCGDDDND
jgi:hypothetical protein